MLEKDVYSNIFLLAIRQLVRKSRVKVSNRSFTGVISPAR